MRRVDFTMADIDRLSRRVPCLCKVAPAKSDVHMEDVHRAGGIMAILGELDRAGLLHTRLPTVHSRPWRRARPLGHQAHQRSGGATFFKAAPGGVPTQTAFSQEKRWDELDLDRENGVIRSKEHAFSKDGGLAVLYGNIALEGLHREDRRRRRQHPEVHRPGRSSKARTRGHGILTNR
jgi:dihydroxy-acid dehydratase